MQSSVKMTTETYTKRSRRLYEDMPPLSSPGMPRDTSEDSYIRPSCYFFALDRPDRLETALFGNRGTI